MEVNVIEKPQIQESNKYSTNNNLDINILKHYLNGLISRNNDLRNAPQELKNYVSVFFKGEGKVSFQLIEFLYVVVNGMNMLPSYQGLKCLHRGWKKYNEFAISLFTDLFNELSVIPAKQAFWEYLLKFFENQTVTEFKTAIANIVLIDKKGCSFMFQYEFGSYNDFFEFMTTEKKELISFCTTLNGCNSFSIEQKCELVKTRFGKSNWDTKLKPLELNGISQLSSKDNKISIKLIKAFMNTYSIIDEKEEVVFFKIMEYWIPHYKSKEKHELAVKFLEQILSEDFAEIIKLQYAKTDHQKLDLLKPLLDYILFISDFYPKIIEMDIIKFYRNLLFYMEHIEYSVNPFTTIDKLIGYSSYEFTWFADEILGHLFFKYEAPWLLIMKIDSIPNGYQLLEWLIKGKRLKDFPDLPIPVTKKESHVFFQLCTKAKARSSFLNSRDILQSGLVLSKIKNISQSAHLISRIETNFYDSLSNFNVVFWEDIARFIKKYGQDIRPNMIVDIIDYFIFKRNRNRNFVIKGRTLASVQRNIDLWHRAQLFDNYSGYSEKWERAPIQDQIITKNHITYKFEQIVTATGLRQEGQTMNHCVFFYVNKCGSGLTSIWSFHIQNQKGIKRLLTIEVKNNSIIQAKGKFNRLPNAKEGEIIKLWAGQNHLKIISY